MLEQSYPNPFNSTAVINYQLPEAIHLTLNIYNIMGQRIRTLIDASMTAKDYSITWDGRDSFGNAVASGFYFYQLKAKNSVLTKRMLLLK